MRLLLSPCGSRGGGEQLVGLAEQLRALGAEAPVCAPSDRAESLARVGVPLAPVGQPARAPVTWATPSAAELPRRATELVAAQFDTIAAAAERCDAPVATGVTPAGVRL